MMSVPSSFALTPVHPSIMQRPFLLGDALLVCPIVEEGGRSRSIKLPKGRWYHFWDDQPIETPIETIEALEAPLERIPLLVRAGSILPMETAQQLTLHLYPPVQGTTEHRVYSDAGDGYGVWRVDRFQLSKTEEGLELTWQHQGEYEFPYKQVILQVHGMVLKRAWIDHEKAVCQGQKITCDRFETIRLYGEIM